MADPQVETDFGQTDFGHPYLTDFWPNRLWPKLVFQSFGLLKKREQQDEKKKAEKNKHFGPRRVWDRRVGPPNPEKWAPKGEAPKPRKMWGPKGEAPNPEKCGARRVGPWSWPTLAKPTLANFSVSVFWPKFLNKKPKP